MSKIKYVIGFIVVFIIEVFIAVYANSTGIIRWYIGDVLVIFALYFMARIFTNKFKKTLPAIIFAFACFVELLQSVDIVGKLGLEKGSVLSIMIGTNGDFYDVLSYAIGTAIIYSLVFIKYKKKGDLL